MLLSSSVFAQEEEERSFFEILKNLGMSDCQVFLQQGDTYSQAMVEAAASKQWDAAFYHDENAFHSYLKAMGHCDAEPENHVLALERLEHNKTNGEKLTCNYHTVQAHDASLRAQLALEHIEDSAQALRHAKLSISYINDAIKYCAFDPARVEKLKKTREGGVEAIALIEYMIQVEKDGH